jgi:dihydrofolate reductase
MVVKIIVSTDIEGGIGKKGCLPWKYLKDDMEYFRNTTMGVTDPLKRNIVVMGGRTFRSIPDSSDL